MTAVDPGRPLVVALLGTDHHPFDRLVDWMDALAGALEGRAHVVVQHGHSAEPRVAEGHAFVGHDHLVRLVRGADVVVCHGGPGTIMDARRAGHVPVCVPRDPALGEHVDGHQQRFAEVAGDAGMVRLATGRADVSAAVLDALAGTGPRVDEEGDDAAGQAAARFGHHVDELVRHRERRVRSVRRALLSRVHR
ncbi:glycosyltransferase [Nocardioides sp. CPCC 205120]|uniref:glycosyltransferase n=1 Tax=Nocardioides sp. CPCC 205120 TaxID=3406462 RepID=UPI003B5066BC